MLQFGHEDLLALLQSAQVMNVRHRANPIAFHRVPSLKRFGASLVPPILAIRDTTNAVLNVIFASHLSITPGALRRLPIVGVECVKPAKSQALVQTQSTEGDPLRASPRPAAVRARQENELRNAGGQ